ncbi:MAG: SBBP repeat-containing protein [Flavobacteriales bacterium]|nr:SBBP repeat-containing protein [Flavobacteriales bacterium]
MKTIAYTRVLTSLCSALLVLSCLQGYTQFQKEWVERYYTYGITDDKASFIETDANGNFYVLGESAGDIVLIKYSASGKQQWIRRYNSGSLNEAYPADLRIDQQGNLYVLGSTRTGSIQYDVVTIKYNANGMMMWENEYSWGGYTNTPVDLTVDLQGNVIILFEGSSTMNNEAIVTLKYNATGSMQWVAVADSADQDIPAGVEVDDLGYIYVAGTTYSSVTKDDFIIVKYDSLGTAIWTTIYDGGSDKPEIAVDIIIDDDNNIYVTGRAQLFFTGPDIATLQIDPISGNINWVNLYDSPFAGFDTPIEMVLDEGNGIYVAGWSYGDTTNYDMLLLHIDLAGNFQWDQRLDLATQSDFVLGLTLVPNGNIAIAGNAKNQAGEYDFLVATYDSTGMLQWTDSITGVGSGDDVVGDLTTDANGNIHVTGALMNQLGNLDIVTVKYDPIGDTILTATFSPPSPNNFRGRDVAVDAVGNVYVTGEIYTANDGYDYGTVKYDSQGNLLWVANYTNTFNASKDDFPLSIAVDASSNIYVTGYTGYANWQEAMTTIKYDAQGVEQWNYTYNVDPAESSRGLNIEFDDQGNTYVAGSVGNTSMSGNPVYLLLTKLDATGNLLWELRFGSYVNSGHQQGFLGMDDSDNLYVAYQEYGKIGISKVSLTGTVLWSTTWQHIDGIDPLTTGINDLYVDQNGNCYVTGSSYKSGIGQYAPCITLKFDTDSNLLWNDIYYASTGDEHRVGWRITADNVGYTYVSASSSGSLLFEPNSYFLIKYGVSGTRVWEDTVSVNVGYWLYSNESANPVAIQILGNGNILVAGNDSGNYRLWEYDTSGVIIGDDVYDGVSLGKDVLTGFSYHPTGGFAGTGYSHQYQNYYSIATVKYGSCTSGSVISAFGYVSNNSDVSFTDNSVFADQWSWDFGDGAFSSLQNPMHTYASPGIYTVCLTVSSACGTDSLCQTVNVLSTAIEKLSPVPRMFIFPNPFNEHSILLVQDYNTNKFDLSIYDLSGKLVRLTKNINSAHVIERNELSKGVYIVELRSKTTVLATQRIVISE